MHTHMMQINMASDMEHADLWSVPEVYDWLIETDVNAFATTLKKKKLDGRILLILDRAGLEKVAGSKVSDI